MDTTQAAAIISQCRSLKEQANILLKKFGNVDDLRLQAIGTLYSSQYHYRADEIETTARSETLALLETYEQILHDSKKILNLKLLRIYSKDVPMQKCLRQLILEAGMFAGAGIYSDFMQDFEKYPLKGMATMKEKTLGEAESAIKKMRARYTQELWQKILELDPLARTRDALFDEARPTYFPIRR